MARSKPKLALFLNHPECSAQSAVGIYEALNSHYDITMFQRGEFDRSKFRQAEIIAVPGGIGDSETFHRIIGDNRHYIQDAVSDGKYYLGICMGAYWATHYYLNLVTDFTAVQYIKRPRSGVKRSYGTTVPITWQTETVDMFFYDGCALVGDESKFTTVARYRNRDPMAVIQNRIGLIGCHPESQRSWYQSKTLQNRWHHYYHHQLLLEFTNLLLEH